MEIESYFSIDGSPQICVGVLYYLIVLGFSKQEEENQKIR